MRIITRAAYLALCAECGHHGHVVCADGTKGEEFATRSGGMKELLILTRAGKVAQDEALEVRHQIEESLTHEDHQIDEIMEKLKEMKKELHGLFDAFHRELTEHFAQAGGDAAAPEKRILH